MGIIPVEAIFGCVRDGTRATVSPVLGRCQRARRAGPADAADAVSLLLPPTGRYVKLLVCKDLLEYDQSNKWAIKKQGVRCFMMKQMRENTKVIIWIVVVAFMVTIFAVWGLDLQRGGGPTAGQYNVLGEVNGVQVTRNQYQAVYEQLAGQMRSASPSGQLTYAQQEMIHEQVWENLITSILTDQEIRKMGIGVTDQEVVSFLRTSPPPEITQHPAFLDDNGNFDFAKYQNLLNDPQQDWTSVEALARQRIPMIKLNRYLMSQVHVSPDDVRERFEEESTEITAEYVAVPILTEDVSGYDPSEDEIQQYYDANPDDYRSSERASVEWVKIPIEPTARDLDDLMFTISMLNGQIEAGEEFDVVARTYSQATTASVGGETGFIAVSHRDTKVMSQVSIMNAGQISQPIQTDDGVYLVKLLEAKDEDGEMKYNIQEIFLELSAGRETVDSLIALARDVQERALESGIADAASQAGLTATTSEPFQRNFPIPGLGFVPSVNRFAFANEAGATSNVINDEDNYYICRVVDRLPEAQQPLDDVRDIIVTRLKFDRQKRMASRKAEAFYLKLMTTPAGFQEAADDYGYTVHKPDPFRVNQPVGDIPPFSPFAYAALKLAADALCPPVESNNAYYVFRVLQRSDVDEAEFASRAPAISDRLHQEKLQAYIGYWYEHLKENAEIKDYRDGA